MQRTIQVSESLFLGVVLAIAGGFMDAYSYIYRGQVFANAQTGNMLLFGIKVSEGQGIQSVSYIFPVLAFTLGIMVSAFSRMRLKEQLYRLHWRQITVLIEALVLVAVAFIPKDLNLIANGLTSMACGIQVESFHKIRGRGIATTMCIGNLRSGTDALCDYIEGGKIADIKKSLLYFGIIFLFVSGAVLGNGMIRILGGKAILVCAGILGIGFLMMFSKESRA